MAEVDAKQVNRSSRMKWGASLTFDGSNLPKHRNRRRGPILKAPRQDQPKFIAVEVGTMQGVVKCNQCKVKLDLD
jgi:hypothetical protein